VIVLLEGGAGSGALKDMERVANAIRRAFAKAHGREPKMSEVQASSGAKLERT
jgi:hypothetical protein